MLRDYDFSCVSSIVFFPEYLHLYFPSYIYLSLRYFLKGFAKSCTTMRRRRRVKSGVGKREEEHERASLSR